MVSGRGLFPWDPAHVAVPCHVQAEYGGEENMLPGVSSYKGTNLDKLGPSLRARLTLIVFLEAPSPNIATLGLRASVDTHWGDTVV